MLVKSDFTQLALELQRPKTLKQTLISLWSNILSVKSFISLIEYFYNVVYSHFYLIKISKYFLHHWKMLADRNVVGCVIPWMTSEDKKPVTKHSLLVEDIQVPVLI